MRKNILFLFLAFSFLQLSARHLQPGFDANEFRTLLSISAYQTDTPWVKTRFPFPNGYDLAYRSPVTGLDNRWDLWMGKDSVAVISIRGTVGTQSSWLENFYAGMIPANGKLFMEDGKTFDYKLAGDSAAYVHIGWTIGLAHIAPGVIEKINEEYKNGIRNIIIMGHSQGGAIADLLTSYLFYEKGKSIPADIVFKTYASGVPKPGNLNYAYDFDFITRGGWAFRIVSTADWVPEVPISIQSLNDVEKGNPFVNISALFGVGNGLEKTFAKHAVRKMNRSTKRARKRFLKYLGKGSGIFVRKTIHGFPKQKFSASLSYMPCGSPIILMADAAYHVRYPDDVKNVFRHHAFGPYLYLLNQYYPVE